MGRGIQDYLVSQEKSRKVNQQIKTRKIKKGKSTNLFFSNENDKIQLILTMFNDRLMNAN